MFSIKVASAFMVVMSTFTAVTGAPASSDAGNAVAAPSCVIGAAAATGTEGSWDINFASVTPSPATRTSYGIDKTWSSQHAMMTMNMGLRHGGDMDLYGAFKCQFHCQMSQGCLSYFARYVDVNSSMERLECVGFNALMDPSVFVPDTAHVPVGGFDQLCSGSQ